MKIVNLIRGPRKTVSPAGSQRRLTRLMLCVSLATAPFVSVVGVSEAQAAPALTIQLQNWATGWCLDSNLNGDVYALPCQRGNGYQTWEIYGPDSVPGANGHQRWVLKNVATGRCLFGNRPRLYTW